jgi:hypothetical protein
MALSLVYRSIKGEFDDAMAEIYEPIAFAGTGAIRDMAASLKQRGRANIAQTGMSKKWQNAFRVDAYPKRRISADAAALVYHKIKYADIFETGGDVRGKPRLWVPLSGMPKKIGRNRFTIKNFKRIGDLVPLNTSGPPLLGAAMTVSPRQAKSGKYGKVTLAKLRKGTAGGGIVRVVPVFVGVSSVHLKRRFALRAITANEANKLPQYYLDNLHF